MGKTAMPIIWFFTKKSSVVSERLNTPALNIVVHLEFHSNNVKKLTKKGSQNPKIMIRLFMYWSGTWYREVAQLGSALGLGPRGRRFESCLLDHLF